MFKKGIKKNPILSIIIPLYNEELRLKNLLKIYQYLNKLNFDYEVIIVNDGSQDNTLRQLKDLNKKLRFRLISHKINRGKGFAIKTAMLAANGKFRLFSDIDLSTPIEEFDKFLPFLKKYDVIISSRRKEGAKLKRRQSFIRESLGRGFTLLSNLILGTNISDFTCGFKYFSKAAAIKIFSLQRIERWTFDSEVLFIAKNLKYKILEIPVLWINDPHTRVKFPQDIIKSLLDLFRIRYYNFRRIY